MMSNSFRQRLITSTARSARSRVNSSGANGFAALRRRMASSSHGEAATGSDRPWQFAAATITIAGSAYLLTPPSKKAAHTVAAANHPIETAHRPATEEGAAVTGQAVKTSTSDEQAGSPESSEGIKDDEGTEVSNEDIKKSVDQGVNTDAPKSAKKAEESSTSTPYDDGAPGMTSAVHDEPKPEIKEKPSQETKKSGSFQESKEDEGPTNLGDARQSAVSKNAPKEGSAKEKED